MNKILKIILVFIVDETGGETVEWVGVVGIIIVAAIIAYDNGLQLAVQSAIGSVAAAIESLYL